MARKNLCNIIIFLFPRSEYFSRKKTETTSESRFLATAWWAQALAENGSEIEV